MWEKLTDKKKSAKRYNDIKKVFKSWRMLREETREKKN